ncbi:MAG: diaminobutyrate acetyltransferase [Steroidobacteraceae bacterium]
MAQTLPAAQPDTIRLRAPCPEDGPEVHRLIAACPPLDANSLYCNLLQCSHFGETCVVAEQDHQLVGWVAGYRLPAEPGTLFVWQGAVAANCRGRGLGGQMIRHLIDRPATVPCSRIRTTVTAENRPSRRMFEQLAASLDVGLATSPLFERERHLDGRHATEHQIVIGPFPRPVLTHFPTRTP